MFLLSRDIPETSLQCFLNGFITPDVEKQKIARKMNYSETTFIESIEMKNDGFDVRIFTPEKELPFAGHPTLGTAFVIFQYILKKIAERIFLNLKAG